MKRSFVALTLVTGVLSVPPSAAFSEEAQTTPGARYSVRVHEFEGCECESVCPCIFSQDTTYGECRTILVFTFNGTYGSTLLKDASCVVVGTSLGKNIEKTAGSWKGILYTSDTATPTELEAIVDLLHVIMGDGFATLDQRKESIQIQRKDDVQELTLGKIAHLRIHALKGQNGKATKVVNAPSPIAWPEMYCAIADVHTYDDGTSSWDFAGRNGFYTDLDLASP